MDAMIESKFDGGLEDRLLLLEHVLVFLSRLPEDSDHGHKLSNKVIKLLYSVRYKICIESYTSWTECLLCS